MSNHQKEIFALHEKSNKILEYLQDIVNILKSNRCNKCGNDILNDSLNDNNQAPNEAISFPLDSIEKINAFEAKLASDSVYKRKIVGIHITFCLRALTIFLLNFLSNSY